MITLTRTNLTTNFNHCYQLFPNFAQLFGRTNGTVTYLFWKKRFMTNHFNNIQFNQPLNVEFCFASNRKYIYTRRKIFTLRVSMASNEAHVQNVMFWGGILALLEVRIHLIVILYLCSYLTYPVSSVVDLIVRLVGVWELKNGCNFALVSDIDSNSNMWKEIANS